MGRHSAATTHWRLGTARAATSGDAARYVGRVGALAVALGVGAAVAGGSGIAYADGTTHDSPADTKSGQSPSGPGAPAGDTDADAHDADGADGKDPQTPGSPGRKPGLLKTAQQVPHMALGANGNGRRSTPRPGASLDEATPHGTHGDDAANPANAVTDSISALPQRITQIVGDVESLATRGTASSPGAMARQSPRNQTQPITAAKPLAAVITQPTDRVRPMRGVIDGGSAPVGVDDPTLNRASVQTPTPTMAVVPQAAAAPRTVANSTVVPNLLSTVGIAPDARTDDAPLTPLQSLLGVLGLITRDVEQALNNAVHQTSPGTTTSQPPAPGDVVDTPYGKVGKWMLNPDGSVANWGGQKYGDTTLREPVNVIIIDPDSGSREESITKLNSAMFWSGFPAQPIHSTGFSGTVLGTTYDQMPVDGSQAAYADLPFFLPNDHARVFGPAPVAGGDGTGYVWTAAASTEVPGIYDNQFTHRYVSYDLARDMLALRLILSGQATFVGVQKMDNVYNEGPVSTGDHDGYAVVLRLNHSAAEDKSVTRRIDGARSCSAAQPAAITQQLHSSPMPRCDLDRRAQT